MTVEIKSDESLYWFTADFGMRKMVELHCVTQERYHTSDLTLNRIGNMKALGWLSPIGCRCLNRRKEDEMENIYKCEKCGKELLVENGTRFKPTIICTCGGYMQRTFRTEIFEKPPYEIRGIKNTGSGRK